MTKPVISTFNQVAPLLVQQYQDYLPNAFSDELSLLQKVNMVIQKLGETNQITNTMITEWNQIMDWVMGEGLSTGVTAKLDEWFDNGKLAEIINNDVFDMKANTTDMVKRSLVILSATQPTETDTEILWLRDLGDSPIDVVAPIDGIWLEDE